MPPHPKVMRWLQRQPDHVLRRLDIGLVMGMVACCLSIAMIIAVLVRQVTA